jgi:hypothetical protein
MSCFRPSCPIWSSDKRSKSRKRALLSQVQMIQSAAGKDAKSLRVSRSTGHGCTVASDAASLHTGVYNPNLPENSVEIRSREKIFGAVAPRLSTEDVAKPAQVTFAYSDFLVSLSTIRFSSRLFFPSPVDAPGGIVATATQFLQLSAASNAGASGITSATAVAGYNAPPVGFRRPLVKRGRGAAERSGTANRIRDALNKISAASVFDSEPEQTMWDPIRAAQKIQPQQRELRKKEETSSKLWGYAVCAILISFLLPFLRSFLFFPSGQLYRLHPHHIGPR